MIYTAGLAYAKAAAITPADGADIPKLANTTPSGGIAPFPVTEGTAAVSPNAVLVGGSGTIAAQIGGTATGVFSVVSGQVLPIQFNRILATGTTATGLIGLWY